MCPFPTTSIGIAAARERHAHLRFPFALVCSAAIHALVSTGMTGGSARTIRPAAPATYATLNAELAPAAPQLSSAVAEDEPSWRAAAPPSAESKRAQARKPRVAAAEQRVETAGPAHLPDPTYYGTRQLDVFPVLASGLELGAAAAGAKAAGAGRVLLLVLIDAAGFVNEVSVIEAEPQGAFEDYARMAFVSARFKPALKDGRPVKSRLLVEVDFGDSAKR
jgi:TonB family protein